MGFDTYHYTIFEMLGNWSFGDDFKREVIQMAWELLTKVWKFPKNLLYTTIYSAWPRKPANFDSEAHDLWKELFIGENMDPKIHIIEGSKRGNF